MFYTFFQFVSPCHLDVLDHDLITKVLKIGKCTEYIHRQSIIIKTTFCNILVDRGAKPIGSNFIMYIQYTTLQ